MSTRLRFDQYMQRCLYDPKIGFYASGRGTAGGRRGDFITSPEVGPLFGAVLANALDEWWLRDGRPDQFVVVDVGEGPGTLRAALRAAAPACAEVWELRGHDLSRPTQLGDLGGATIIANELLDNMAFRIVRREPTILASEPLVRHGWSELWVDDPLGPSPQEHWQPGEGPEPPFLVDAPGGAPYPWFAQAAEWISALFDANVKRILAIDYAVPTTAEMAQRGGWLRTYREHQRGHDPLYQPGLWDITSDVPVDQLARPDVVESQADFLKRYGIAALVEEGRQAWELAAAAPDVAALRMRSRVRESEALLDPGGLGGFTVMTWD